MSELCFFNPFTEIRVHRNFLPHWQQPGATYFVTFRLADSIPSNLLDQWRTERKAWQRQHPKPWDLKVELEYHARFSQRIDTWLDGSHGLCWLRAEEIRAHLAATLRYSDQDRYFLHAWVIMPNHVHVLFSLHESAELEDEVGAWKSVAARAINRQVKRRGTVWQEDYFDRMIRDLRHFENCVRYIRRNPEKAHLRDGEYELFERDFALEVL
jgi:putative transposase